MRVNMKTVFAPSVLRVPRLIGLALCLTFAPSAHTHQASSADASASDTNLQLLQRINQLEAKVKQLEEKQAPAPAPEPVVEGPRVNAVNDRLKFNVFGDVGYRATDRKATPNTFEIGSLDL